MLSKIKCYSKLTEDDALADATTLFIEPQHSWRKKASDKKLRRQTPLFANLQFDGV